MSPPLLLQYVSVRAVIILDQLSPLISMRAPEGDWRAALTESFKSFIFAEDLRGNHEQGKE
jgi:hypothetical protein